MQDQVNHELLTELLNAKIVFGLQKQGHIVTIEKMLAENSTWEDIGKKIGWCPVTAQKHYEQYLNPKNQD